MPSWCTNKSIRLKFADAAQAAPLHTFFWSYSWVSPLVLYYLPSWNHNHSFVFSAQISRSPQRFSFVVQPTGQSPCTPTHTHPHAFSLPGPAQSTGSFDLVYILLFWTYLLPLSGPPSGLGEDETSLTSSLCSLSPPLPNVFSSALCHFQNTHWPLY